MMCGYGLSIWGAACFLNKCGLRWRSVAEVFEV
jgi:hypothetical protein